MKSSNQNSDLSLNLSHKERDLRRATKEFHDMITFIKCKIIPQLIY